MWRLIPRIEDCAAMQMALDEAILTARSRSLVPNTLRFFTWKPPAITIGYFQSIDKEVDRPKARKMGIDVVRRYTGGGAVLHDNELTYSIAMSEKDVPADIIASYDKICAAIINGLQSLGISAQFSPVNDILVNGKKISGNAQTRRQGVMLQHGTILCDVDVRKMFSLLKVPDEKLKDKMIKAAEERVTSLKQELGKNVCPDELQEAIAKGFEKAFDAKFVKGNLSDEEKAEAARLCKEKYSTPEWNEMR
jgi:lipoate-protein ligase A